MKMRMAALMVGALAVAGVATAQKETRGVSKTEIVLGMHTDLSGPAATYGVSSSNAVKMRFDEANATGGIHGRKIRLVVEDTQYQVPRAVQAGTKLINRDRIFAMVAPLGTPMNNALFKDQFEAGVPNLFPLSAARSMYEPFHRLKFYGAASYVDQIRAGINYFVTKKGKKALCAMYQDTDFGKEVLDGVQIQAEKMRIKVLETTTHKPTDQDFTAQITKLKAAGCDLVALGTIVRDSIVPYATARKIGWTDVDFLGSAATYDLFVAAAQGGVYPAVKLLVPKFSRLNPASGLKRMLGPQGVWEGIKALLKTAVTKSGMDQSAQTVTGLVPSAQALFVAAAAQSLPHGVVLHIVPTDGERETDRRKDESRNPAERAFEQDDRRQVAEPARMAARALVDA